MTFSEICLAINPAVETLCICFFKVYNGETNALWIVLKRRAGALLKHWLCVDSVCVGQSFNPNIRHDSINDKKCVFWFSVYLRFIICTLSSSWCRWQYFTITLILPVWWWRLSSIWGPSAVDPSDHRVSVSRSLHQRGNPKYSQHRWRTYNCADPRCEWIASHSLCLSTGSPSLCVCVSVVTQCICLSTVSQFVCVSIVDQSVYVFALYALQKIFMYFT